MKASQAPSKTADKLAQKTAGTVKLFRIEPKSDIPLAGMSEVHTLKEWKRIYGYEPGYMFCGKFVEVIRTAPAAIKTITCKFGDIEILARDRFIIAEFAQYGGRGYYCDTSDLSSIVAILNRPEWDEEEINAAVAALNKGKAQ